MVAEFADCREDIKTKMRIIKAVTAPLDEMTVQDICRGAGISRQTFYNHFQTKFSLVPWWSAWCEDFYLSRIGFEYSWEEGAIRHAQLLLSEKDFLFNALRSKKYRAELGVTGVARHRRKVLRDALARKGVEVDSLMEFCIAAQTRSEADLTYEYFRRGNKTPGDIDIVDTAKNFVAIVPMPLYNALQLPGQTPATREERFADMDRLGRAVLNEETSLAGLM